MKISRVDKIPPFDGPSKMSRDKNHGECLENRGSVLWHSILDLRKRKNILMKISRVDKIPPFDGYSKMSRDKNYDECLENRGSVLWHSILNLRKRKKERKKEKNSSTGAANIVKPRLDSFFAPFSQLLFNPNVAL
ncbi:hypothetical protein AVEN_226347-1 [Araneus ventricosus]|uniref:Uncharacterized protein n=1 Tax=Araneus ventricosus TaxID=182803 RepID=A0A4Y2IMG4_ARAVE|nr:hypothetical protein AVEN_226347-1 [Araneus ventricosus]